METTRKSAQTVGTGCCLLQHLVGLLNDRINLRVILLHVLLRDFEELPFGLLHQVVHILRFVERLGLYAACERNQFTRQKLLGNDAGMVFNVGRRRHLTTQLRDIKRSTHLFQVATRTQLFRHGQDINRFLLDAKSVIAA